MEYRKEYILKNGKTLIVRSPNADDAKMLAYLTNIIHDETKFLGYSSSEKSYSAEDEIAYVEKIYKINGAFLVGEYEGNIVGTTQIMPKDEFKWKSHIARFGIGLIKNYWGLGIAGKMMTSIIDCAKSCGYEQIELNVVAENTRAVNLYKSFGFEIYGTIKNAYKFSPNHYSDSYIMIKFLK